MKEKKFKLKTASYTSWFKYHAVASFNSMLYHLSLNTTPYFYFFHLSHKISNCCSISSEDYDDERATAHVRRALDLVACTTSFGPSPANKDQSLKSDALQPSGGVKNASSAQDNNAKEVVTMIKSQGSSENKKQDVIVDIETDASHTCPKLGSFYEFFSLSHLTSPIQCTFSTQKHLK